MSSATTELAVTLIALAAFTSSFALGFDPRLRVRVVLLALGLSGGVGVLVVFGGFVPASPTPVPGPVQVLRDGYVSSDRCRACHPSQYESWHQSFHRTMTQPATPDTIEAPMTGDPIEMWGQSYRFFVRDGQPWVELPDPTSPSSRQDRNATLVASGPKIERPLALVTGSHHYQVYWASRSDDSRDLMAVPLVWRIAEQRFIPRSAAFLTPPEMSNRELPWGLVCLKCHATGGRPGVELNTDYVELGIACEACHGPAQEHIEHHQNPIRRYRAHLRDDDARDPTIANPAKLDGTRGSEICAQCHSLLIIPNADDFIANGTPFRPGDAIAEHFPDLRGESESEAERAGSFWSDGEIRLTGREWVSMTQSACHVRGELSCMDCHSMHEGSRDDQLDPVRGGDAGCSACHARTDYETEAHTHHQAGSSGSSCLNCHMPLTNYGLLKAVRSHRITSPAASTTLATGRPNACNLCHLDQTLAWTADKLSAWYGHEDITVPGPRADVADMVHALLSGDAGQRALAAAAMGWAPAQEVSGTSWMPPFLVLGLNDPYDAVRQIAERSLRTLPGYEGFAYDALAVQDRRIADVENLIPEWFERHAGEIAAMPTTVPLDETFGFDRNVLQTLLMQRDQRPIVLTE